MYKFWNFWELETYILVSHKVLGMWLFHGYIIPFDAKKLLPFIINVI